MKKEIKHLTTRQLAERWGMHPGSLANWRTKNIGPRWIPISYKKVLYALKEVERFEREQRRKKN